MFKNLMNNIKTKYNEKKQENNTLNSLLKTTTTIKNLYPINNIQEKLPLEYKTAFILEQAPDINEEKAQLITKIIPIDETYLTVFYIKEVLTNREYFLIPTNKNLWLMNQQYYGAYTYNNITCTIIKNNLMSKILLFNNILIEVNGNDQKINHLLNIINNPEYRNQQIQKSISYLCGIIPIQQKINTIKSGISWDNNHTIIFHTKDNNYKYHINEIENYEILLDNMVYSSKKTTTSKSIGTFQTSCYQITIRITPKEKEPFTIPILNQNTFGTKYESHDTIYIKNLEFANSIIQTLNDLQNSH